MAFDASTFVVHDVEWFPVVRVQSEAIRPGYAVQWVAEMNALIARGEPFAVIYVGAQSDEAHEDRKRRGIWLKQHADALARMCKVLVTVEADDALREGARVSGRGVTRAFGIPHRAVANWSEALDIVSCRVEVN
ncbi:hypothetical protein [Burkholderia sp. TSV86]|uniref:hypothetical protein n=1 Tax=Burkholderia sp. TSV86 TaxID=1385594 RepID=UPI00075E9108|nr:hypothetical protein [Burkholderia sp. TSV86]KVE35375.1 hypothetical protein WS68_07485 [Burkholderia sp. TSV86]